MTNIKVKKLSYIWGSLPETVYAEKACCFGIFGILDLELSQTSTYYNSRKIKGVTTAV